VTTARVVVFDAAAYPSRAAAVVADAILNTITARGRCAIALAGGDTPRPVYRELGRLPATRVPWDRVHVFFGDERAVPLEHADSNFRAAHEALLRHVAIPPAQIHAMPAFKADLAAAAEDYDALLPDPLDLLILGMGTDGHTASLFPGSPALHEPVRRVVPVTGPVPPLQRLTITPPVISRAREVIMLVTGSAKAGLVARALSGPWDPGQVPAQLARDGWWILDPPAAAQMPAA
jgi:6-phosphogluconolactonase